LNNQVRHTLPNVKPTWKIFDWHPTSGQLVNSSITLLIEFVCKWEKCLPVTARNVITILKPIRNAQPSDRSRRHSWIWLRNTICLWARRLRETGRLWETGPLLLHGIGEVHMGWWVISIWHGHRQGRLWLRIILIDVGGRTPGRIL
jgi:hypothetical protein